MTGSSRVKTLLFDVSGTVVDWRSGVIRDAAELTRAKGAEIDAAGFAERGPHWRDNQAPARDYSCTPAGFTDLAAVLPCQS